MFKNQMTRVMVVACGIALLFAGTAMARGPIATADVGPTQINWAPAGSYSLQLTVSGPNGFRMQKTFDAGQVASFSLFNQDGNILAAGSYKYELRAIPQLDQAAREELAAAREAGVDAGVLRKSGKLPAVTEPLSGAFAIRDGAIVMGGAEEPGQGKPAAGNQIAVKDQVINDDLIVDGSACIGFDCANNENFGFDTLRLKENNTRIKFDDTSTSGGFPNVDWQLTANDSSSGGANKFTIDDISNGKTPFTIEANTPNNTLYVDSSGRVGIGTSSPVVQIHTVDGNTPALRLEQDGSSGFTPQTWDVAGNETNFFVRDATNGSKIPFKIIPNAPTNSLYVSANGDVGMGTASPSQPLHIKRTNDSDFVLALLENNGPARMRFANDTDNVTWNIGHKNPDGDSFVFSDVGDADTEMELDVSGNLTITGTLTTGGMTCGSGCDRVFDPGYTMPTIAEHAAAMYADQHLPEVGPTVENQPVNLTEKLGGMLNELEKAHVFIAQLQAEKDQQVNELRGEIEQLKNQLKEMSEK